jgi:GNAT superfamily N-acetyltransferase
MPSTAAAHHATVRLLQEQDIATAAGLSAEAGWNQTPEDWRMLLRLNPEGCFGIDGDGRLVSTATLVCYGRALGWIGMVLTTASYRRRGYARTLLLHAIERADQLGIEALKLDATDQGQPLYESLGFRVEQPVERWWRPGGMPAADDRQAHFLSVSNALDLEAFGTDRSRWLRALGERSRVYAEQDGFCLRRPGKRCDYVGPCVSQNADSARRFIERCASSECCWDLLPHNEAALTIATGLGFTRQRQLVRMVRGRDLRGREDWIYAIAGFELG